MVTQPPESVPRSSLSRSVAAVGLGFLVLGGLSVLTDMVMRLVGLFPTAGAIATPALVLAVIYRLAFTVAGGYVTARVAPGKPLAHAVSLGFCGTVVAITGAAAVARQAPDSSPLWYPLAIIAATLPCSGLGGLLGVRR